MKNAHCGGVALLCHTRLTKRLLLTMKLTAIILLATCLQVSAIGKAQNVTLSEKNASLEKIFREIKRQTGYSFLYSSEVLKRARKVDIEVRNTPLADVLNTCFANQPLTWELEDKLVIVKPKVDSTAVFQPAPTAPIDVRGRVTNEKGEPLEGVTVTIKGTTTSTVTNKNGEFSLTGVDNNAVLVFSSVNMNTFEADVKGRLFHDITLQTKVADMQEVVINTGYQQLSSGLSIGSYSKPDMQIIKNRSFSQNIIQRLDGLVPGLVINNAPTAAQFLVRGLTTINETISRNPLYVVDGVVMEDISSINPQDMDDVTVLKDATAASIYGARSANGVIVITTKRGKPGEKISVQYDGFFNFQGKPDLDYIRVLATPQYITAAKDMFDPVLNPWNQVENSGLAPHHVILYNQYRGIITPAQANAQLDSLAALNNLQQIEDFWYRNAALMNHTVSLSGGSRIHSFYGSLSYTNTQSNEPGAKNQSYKANLRQDFNFHKNIQLYLITDLTNTVTSQKRSLNVDNSFLPYQLFRDANGNNLSMPWLKGFGIDSMISRQNRSGISLDYNPLNEMHFGYTKGDNLHNRIVAGAKIRLFKGLSFEGVYGYVKGANKITSYDDTKSYLVRSEVVQFTTVTANGPNYVLPKEGGRYTVTNASQRNWSVRNQLIYNNQWNKGKHVIKLLAGQESQEQLGISTRTTVRGYNELLQTYASLDYNMLATTGVVGTVWPTSGNRSVLKNDVFTNTESLTRFSSYYANALYAFNRKYSLHASWRIDESNLFGKDKSAQNKPVYSVGGKWVISKEKFMSPYQWLGLLAFRATYGITGNAPSPATASSYNIYSAISSSLYPGGTGLHLSLPGNTRLTWERTATINLGLDFSIFRNRLNGSVDLYQKKTEDLIGNLQTSPFAGFSNIIGNYGNLQNKGIELSLQSNNIQRKNFSWTTNFTLSYNKNKITELTVAPAGDALNFSGIQEGYSAFAQFAYRFAGLDTLGDPMIYLESDKSVTKTPNKAKRQDLAYMGTSQPVWSGGLSNTFSYKSFGLNVNTIYHLGHVMKKDVNNKFSNSVGLANQNNLHVDFDKRWKKKGDEAFTNIPSFVSSPTASIARRSQQYYTNADVHYVSASFIKLRDITLFYHLPQSILSRIRAKEISLRMQVSNIMLWKSNEFGIDPEFQQPSSGTRSLRYGQGQFAFGAHIIF